MPYIRQDIRVAVDPVPFEDDKGFFRARNPGELNFQITRLIQYYAQGQQHNYQFINDVLGALEGAKMEFYRRVAAPYEDNKIKENGDVY